MRRQRILERGQRSGRLPGILAAAGLLALLPLSAADANGLFENRSWQFKTSADRANQALVADLIERKKGGFFDSFGPPTITNCNLSADAAGSVAATEMLASTSSPDIAPGSNMVADSVGNEALNSSVGDGPLNSSQSNTGSQQASVSDNTATVGDVDASGGTTTQTSDTVQTNSGDQTVVMNNVSVC